MEQAYGDFKSINNLSEESARRLWPAGGGGVTFRDYSDSTVRYVYPFAPGGWQSDTYNIPGRQQIMAYGHFVTTIHEMFHAAGKTSSFSEKQMNDAARNLGASGFDNYVRKHCVPQQYW